MLENIGIVLSIRSIVQRLFGTLVLVLLAGCGTLYELEITARNSNQVELRGSYVLVPGNPDISVSSAEFERYSNQVERGLSGHELRRLPIAQLADADMAIVVNYSVSEPELVGYSSNVPMFQETSQPSSEEGTRQSSSSRNRVGSGAGAQSSPGVVDPPPKSDLIGTQSYTFVRTMYWRDLSLQAITFELDGEDKPSIHRTGRLWLIMVQTHGSSPDLDEVLPVMIAAAKPYVGVHSDELIVEKMNGIDRRIKKISEE